MTATAREMETAMSDGRARVLVAFAASLAVHATLLAAARGWHAAEVASLRPLVVTLRASGGDGAPAGGSGGAVGAAMAVGSTFGGAHAATADHAIANDGRAATAPAPSVPASVPAERVAAPRVRVRSVRAADAPGTRVATRAPRPPSESRPREVERSRTAAVSSDAAAKGSVASAAVSARDAVAGDLEDAAGADGGGGGSGTATGGSGGDGHGRRGTGAGDGSDGLRAFCASCPAPEYPSRARRQGWQGTVDVALAIGGAGDVTAASVRRSSGYPALDEVALEVARRSRFTVPATGAVLRGELRYRFVLDATAAQR